MTIGINDPPVDSRVDQLADYEDVIRDAVRAAMRAPEMIASRRRFTDIERAEVVVQLHELRALLYRLLDAITRS